MEILGEGISSPVPWGGIYLLPVISTVGVLWNTFSSTSVTGFQILYRNLCRKSGSSSEGVNTVVLECSLLI